MTVFIRNSRQAQHFLRLAAQQQAAATQRPRPTAPCPTASAPPMRSSPATPSPALTANTPPRGRPAPPRPHTPADTHSRPTPSAPPVSPYAPAHTPSPPSMTIRPGTTDITWLVLGGLAALVAACIAWPVIIIALLLHAGIMVFGWALDPPSWHTTRH